MRRPSTIVSTSNCPLPLTLITMVFDTAGAGVGLAFTALAAVGTWTTVSNCWTTPRTRTTNTAAAMNIRDMLHHFPIGRHQRRFNHRNRTNEYQMQSNEAFA